MTVLLRSSLMQKLAFGAVLLSSAPAIAQDATSIIASESTKATVETIDTQAGMVLLRDQSGALVTIHYGKEVRDLPRVHPGDVLSLHSVQTVGADIVRPGTPDPISTIAVSGGYVNGRPHGIVATFTRERVRIVSVNPALHSVTFETEDKKTHTVIPRTPAMRALVKELKAGDELNVSWNDAVSFTVVSSLTSAAPQDALHKGTVSIKKGATK